MASNQYVNNKDLYCEIIVSKAQGKLTPKAERILYLMGKKIITKFSYSVADDKLDCLQEGLYQLYKNWHLFDENKTDNTFAFYTEIFKRGVAAGFNKVRHKKRGEYLSKLTISMNGLSDERYDMNI